MTQLKAKNDEQAYGELKTEIERLFDLGQVEYNIAGEVFKQNIQTQAKKNAKFDIYSNTFDMSLEKLRIYVSLLRSQASMAFDLQGIPSTSQANDLLGLYLNS